MKENIKRVLCWLSKRTVFETHIGVLGLNIWLDILKGWARGDFKWMAPRVSLQIIHLAADLRWFKPILPIVSVALQVQNCTGYPWLGVRVSIFGLKLLDNEADAHHKADEQYRQKCEQDRQKALAAAAALKEAGVAALAATYAEGDYLLNLQERLWK